MDGIGRRRCKHHIPGPDGHQDQMGHTLFDADGDDGLGVRIDVHIKTAFVPARDGVAQFGDSHGGRITVVMRFLHGFHHLFDDVFRCAEIRIPHAQVDNILPGPARFHKDFRNFGKHVRWQTVQSRKLSHDQSLFIKLKNLRPPPDGIPIKHIDISFESPGSIDCPDDFALGRSAEEAG